VVAVPGAGGEIVGLSERYPGGFAERVVVAADMLIPIPAHIPADHAALTEPLAVGAHAVAAAPATPAVLVLGCGPIGLAVIAALKATGRGGAEGDGVPAAAAGGAGGAAAGGGLPGGGVPGSGLPGGGVPGGASADGAPGDGAPGGGGAPSGAPRVIAVDLSPARRALAQRMGADEVVDPGAGDPYARLTACLPPAEAPGGSLRGERAAPQAVIFECVGVPGMIQQVFAGAPARARVVVAGACMEPDTTVPVVALVKELTVAYVFGYTRAEFAATLDAIGSGAVDPAPLITGTVGLDGVADAFTALADPERHAKILVHPREATP
jgi:threonine dehydrogenase-like Zn-dependent dehydrogenase